MISLICTIALFVAFNKQLERLNYSFSTTLELFAGVWVILHIMYLVIAYYGTVGFF